MTQIATGTKVVLREDIKANAGQPSFAKGSPGMVIKMPVDTTHAWRIRFPDGNVGSFRRDQFCTLDVWQMQDLNQPGSFLLDYNLNEHVIYRCVVGSRAYGLDHDQSDTDLRGVYLPPAELHWSLYGVPEQLENKEIDECYWEFQKFLNLALKANPNILECLYTPLIDFKNNVAERLLSQRKIFLSKLAYQTYNGYVMSQFKKMTNRIARGENIKWKHAMHLIRLLYSGIGVLKQERVIVHVEEHRQQLLDIRHGLLNWQQLDQLRLKLHNQFDQAFKTTDLPDRPDYAAANQLLIWARHSMVKE